MKEPPCSAEWNTKQPADSIETCPASLLRTANEDEDSTDHLFALATYKLIEADETRPQDRIGRVSMLGLDKDEQMYNHRLISYHARFLNHVKEK